MNKQRNQLHLVLKREWYDMIASGEKKEEYREIKPYWEKRLLRDDGSFKQFDSVVFQCGCNKKLPVIEVSFVTAEIRTGRTKWGAESGKLCYVISLGDIISVDGVAVKRSGKSPKSFWHCFADECPDQYGSELSDCLEYFSDYLVPFRGQFQQPHRNRVDEFCQKYSDEIACASRDVVLIAYWKYFNNMFPFAVSEVFRERAV